MMTDNIKYNKLLSNKKQYVIPQEDCMYNLAVIQNYFEHCNDIYTIPIIDIHTYPSMSSHLYNSYVRNLSRLLKVKKDNIITTSGSDNALNLIINAFVTPESNVCIPVPNYPHFESFVDLVEKNKLHKPVIHTVEELLNVDYSDYHLVYISSPNLPLGYTLTHDKMIYLLNKYPDTLFIFDAAYIEYSNVARYHHLSTVNENMIATFTFSKAFGLAGARIGGLTASNRIIKLLTPLVNTKSVTTYAIEAANTCLLNYNHYNLNVQVVETLKNNLKKTFNSIISIDAEVYDYHIADGNFLLIKSRDTVKTCKTFYEHGILIRDKSSEIKDSIRICIATPEIMELVVNIIKFINMKHIIKSVPVIIDVDGTLRDGVTDKYYNVNLTNMNSNTMILTNNKHVTLTDIQGIPVITSTMMAKEYIKRNHPDEKYIEIEDINDTTDLSVYKHVILNSTRINMDTITRMIINKVKVYPTDTSLYTDMKNSSEYLHLLTDKTTNATLPDIGIISRLLSPCLHMINSSKQSLATKLYNCDEYEYVIGDSESDRVLALSLLKSKFIKVGCQKNRYDFETNTFEYINVEHLFN